MKKVDAKMDLPKLEEEILRFWNENKTFEKSLENRKESPLYSFYDGPPFATGTPHYGHILTSAMKDAVPRYWTMKGFSVPRKWGWDCHGLPIENIAEKELGITHKKQIEELGVKKFNDVCRSKILEYVSEWEKIIPRLGRWVDMKNSYKTMDLPYMESVWWTFKQLWDKGLIYEGYRSMHICPRCETTLSQSEVAEGYRMVKDLSVIAEFKLIDDPNTSILAWTTTPWTLIGNVALTVGKNIDYIKIEKQDQDTGELVRFILAKDRLEYVFPNDEYEIIETIKGQSLIGLKYQPLFDYYAKNEKLENRDNGWKVVDAPFVTTEEGTGVVHIAPAFGEDDMNLGQEKSLPFVQHVGMDGVIKPEVGEFAGLHVKPIEDVQATDVLVIKYLASHDLLFSKEKFEHSYPHCWRCDTPLINYATSSWFVDIGKIKERALELAKEINWSPQHIKEGRFGKWLEGARDWSISRQRYWASVIPIWRCDKCGELEVIGSIADLEKVSSQKVTDLHKDVVDNIIYPCQCGVGTMKRIPDVLDTWFDSGSMPYAQQHYPFENQDQFKQSFPADYIGEGVDQTRAWFYYLHTIATAIKDSVAFKNVIVNGIVLAEDGKKMSKRLKNYPDPTEVFNKYGADVLRLYLLSSPVVTAENINFSEKELAEMQRGLFRMLWNSYYFFTLYAGVDNWKPNSDTEKSSNLLDQWILSELNSLIQDVNDRMMKYDLMKSSRLFWPFIDNLSNWYIRRSRKRFWKSENDSDKNEAYQTLFEVLVTLCKLMAPFTPFIAEEIYRNLTDKESVHLANFPESKKEYINEQLNQKMKATRAVVELGLAARAEAKIKVRQPLQSLAYSGEKLDAELESIISDEVNVKEVMFSSAQTKPVELNTEISEELKLEGYAREIIRSIQELRKNSGFNVEDRINLMYETDSAELKEVFTKFGDLIAKEVLAQETREGKAKAEGQQEYSIESYKIWIGITRLNNDSGTSWQM